MPRYHLIAARPTHINSRGPQSCRALSGTIHNNSKKRAKPDIAGSLIIPMTDCFWKFWWIVMLSINSHKASPFSLSWILLSVEIITGRVCAAPAELWYYRAVYTSNIVQQDLSRAHATPDDAYPWPNAVAMLIWEFNHRPIENRQCKIQASLETFEPLHGVSIGFPIQTS